MDTDSQTLSYMDIISAPFSGILIKNEEELIVGCSDGSLCLFSLAIPSIPKFLKALKLWNQVMCLLIISDDTIICGQEKGFLDTVNYQLF